MSDIEGFVLNGGKSSRMGSAKGTLKIGEKTLVERAAEALNSVCERVCVVGGEDFDSIEVLPDIPWHGSDQKASIFGLRSALLHCSTKFAAVLACDMPFVTSDVILRLTADCHLLEAGNVDVIIPSDENGWLQPLCAIYEADRCRRAIDVYLESGELQVRGFVNELRTYVVDASSFEEMKHAGFVFMNLNLPEEMVEAKRILS